MLPLEKVKPFSIKRFWGSSYIRLLSPIVALVCVFCSTPQRAEAAGPITESEVAGHERGLDRESQQSPSVPIVLYQAPTYLTVIDPFRPPQHFAGAGNRGLEYGYSEDQLVMAAAEGFVAYSGSVAGTGVISIEHADGLRTTYTNLKEIWIEDYQYVYAGHTLGIAGPGFHFGVKIGDRYLDPAILIEQSLTPPKKAKLVID